MNELCYNIYIHMLIEMVGSLYNTIELWFGK